MEADGRVPLLWQGLRITVLFEKPNADPAKPMNAKITLRITNHLDRPQTLVLEPWTTERTLQAGDSVDVLAEGDPSLPLELEATTGGWILHCFDSKGALLTVAREPGPA
jgi:hypothetical protein